MNDEIMNTVVKTLFEVDSKVVANLDVDIRITIQVEKKIKVPLTNVITLAMPKDFKEWQRYIEQVIKNHITANYFNSSGYPIFDVDINKDVHVQITNINPEVKLKKI